MSAPQTGPSDRRRLWLAIALATVLAVTLGTVLVLSGNTPTSGSGSPGFEPVYEDLEQRREAAGVSTMGNPADPDAHLHPKLALYAEGERIQIPVNIGIDPTQSGEQMASLHTHETDGTIHMEGMSDATLGQFFQIWGVPFSTNELGSYEVAGDKSMRMWVDGTPSDEFDQLQLADGQEIVVAYGTPDEIAQAAP